MAVGVTDKIPFRVQPMLATLVSEPFDRPGWVYEEKYDGFRILAYKEGASVSRSSWACATTRVRKNVFSREKQDDKRKT